MLEFKPITLSDKSWISPLIRCENSKSADSAFGTMYLWSAGETRYVARSNDRVVLMLNDGDLRFLFPFGCGTLYPVIMEMKEYCDNLGKPLKIVGVPENYIPVLHKLFPDTFKISVDERYSDYVYTAEKLSTLRGKALHAKRNHINSFLSNNSWRFEPLSKKHVPQCIALMESWRDADPDRAQLDVFDEHDTLLRALDEFSELGIYGAVLTVDATVIAFTMGEQLCDDTFVVHFEKAEAEIRGAYPMINCEFVKYIKSLFPDIEYINREDDMGLENIKRAKMSYKPDMMILKYTAVWGDELED